MLTCTNSSKNPAPSNNDAQFSVALERVNSWSLVSMRSIGDDTMQVWHALTLLYGNYPPECNCTMHSYALIPRPLGMRARVRANTMAYFQNLPFRKVTRRGPVHLHSMLHVYMTLCIPDTNPTRQPRPICMWYMCFCLF